MTYLRNDDIVIPQGTTWAIRWPIEDSENFPVDLKGWTVRSQVRETLNSDIVLHEWSTILGNATVENSYIEFRVSPDESSNWNWSHKYPPVFDIELSSPEGNIYRITQGTVKISPEVTR